MSSFVNLRSKIPKSHNLSKLLKDVHTKLAVFKVTEVDQDIVESTILENQSLFVQYMSEKF